MLFNDKIIYFYSSNFLNILIEIELFNLWIINFYFKFILLRKFKIDFFDRSWQTASIIVQERSWPERWRSGKVRNCQDRSETVRNDHGLKGHDRFNLVHFLQIEIRQTLIFFSQHLFHQDQTGWCILHKKMLIIFKQNFVHQANLHKINFLRLVDSGVYENLD